MLLAAHLTAEQFIAVVRDAIADGQVCDWVVKNVRQAAWNKSPNCHRQKREKEALPWAPKALEQDRNALRAKAILSEPRNVQKTMTSLCFKN